MKITLVDLFFTPDAIFIVTEISISSTMEDTWRWPSTCPIPLTPLRHDCEQPLPKLSHLPSEKVSVVHIEIVFDSLELIWMCLIEWQRHGVTESLLPRSIMLAAKDLRQISAISNRDELALVSGIRSPLNRSDSLLTYVGSGTFHCHSPDPPLDGPEVGFVTEVRPESSIPVAAHLIFEIPPLNLVYSYA